MGARRQPTLRNSGGATWGNRKKEGGCVASDGRDRGSDWSDGGVETPFSSSQKCSNPCFHSCCCVLIVVSNVRAQAKKVSSFCLLIFFLFLKSSFSLFKSLQHACACVVFFFALGNYKPLSFFEDLLFLSVCRSYFANPFLGKTLVSFSHPRLSPSFML